jgi:hypothetical protein
MSIISGFPTLIAQPCLAPMNSEKRINTALTIFIAVSKSYRFARKTKLVIIRLTVNYAAKFTDHELL